MESMKLRLSILTVSILIFIGVIYIAVNFGFDDDFEKTLYEVNGFVQDGGVYTVFLFILIYIFFATFVFWVPVWLMSVMGGAFFGLLPGILYSVTGLMLGAVGSFELVRYAERGFLINFISKKTDRFQKMCYSMRENNFVVVLTLRLVHFIPFRGLSYGAGLTKISFEDYFLGTFLGIMPAVVFYVYLGESLMNYEYVDATVAVLFAFLFSIVIFWQRNSINYWQRRIKTRNL